ncbi:hypothetical protein CIG75_03110 [Tumebacillus algifaecis]|uniref:YqzN/YkzM domain-containing protein n=1 Tax=Tumebacillus algifaecis TaxID=1214604 RepID=A0A223CXQ0_9BACL|nr:hypothetical protein [Tumebacillus algifaecis]ASS74071.1 hypothetical protein CIG75_03110 [Tumebacillus algifaecis]
MEQLQNETVFRLQEFLEIDSHEVLQVAPFVLKGAIAHAGLSADDQATLSQVKQAVQAFLQAPAK